MPQLDIASFLSQYVWLLLFFFIIYNSIGIISFPNLILFKFIHIKFSGYLKAKEFINLVLRGFYKFYKRTLLGREYIINQGFLFFNIFIFF